MGAGSSLAIDLLKKITPYSPEIIRVYRNSHSENHPVNNNLYLDLTDKNSLNEFVKNIQNQEFTHIYIFIGKTSNIDLFIGQLSEIENYYQAYAANLNFLMARLYEVLTEAGSMIFISSRAAHKVSYDAHYSAVKSSNEAFLRSLAGRNGNKRVLILAPSLIENSTMFAAMDENTILKHRARTNNGLLTIQEVTDKLIKISLYKETFQSGQIITIGGDW